MALVVLAVVLVTAVVLRLAVGSQGLAWPESAEVWRIRGDRVLAAVVVGAALALGGTFLQVLLRNPLASPDLIGAASGAGFAVMAWVVLSGNGSDAAWGGAGWGGVARGLVALCGACGTMLVVYAIAQRRGLVEPASLLLVGVMVSVLCGAGTLLLAHLTPDRGLGVARWTVGTLTDDSPRWAVVVGLVAVVGGALLGSWRGQMLDAATLGDDEAHALGVPIGRVRVMLFVAAGVLTALAVSIAGPVGFVGLVCPHVTRLLAGPASRGVVVGSAISGAALMVGADALVRAVELPSGRLPIGVITALIGGPVFLVMLRGERR